MLNFLNNNANMENIQVISGVNLGDGQMWQIAKNYPSHKSIFSVIKP